jgi:hypothetical protein
MVVLGILPQLLGVVESLTLLHQVTAIDRYEVEQKDFNKIILKV